MCTDVECVHAGVEGGGIKGIRKGVEHVHAVSRAGVSKAYARMLNAYARYRGRGHRGRGRV